MHGFLPAAPARIVLPVIHRTTLRPVGPRLSIVARSIANSSSRPRQTHSQASPSPSDTPPPTARAHSAPYPKRTHSCGALSLDDVGSKVVLTGWLCPGRQAGKKFAFFPLRDVHGTTQLFVQKHQDDSTLTEMWEIPSESTVLIEGIVNARPQSQRRPIPAGDVEVRVTSFTLLNRADPDLPFMPLDSHNLANEDLRLRYRYLDLRRAALSDNIRKRSQVAHIVRTVLHDHEFSEVETPILLKSSPEGAREFLVPTRVAGSSQVSSSPAASSQPLFYALPQSPQQPKQLLVASGAVDRYYQLARCFRDEDGRKDRQPEFTQIDLEMAWVSWGPPAIQPTSTPSSNGYSNQWRIGGTEVKEVIEALIRKIWRKVEGVDLPPIFPVMTYEEAMSRYGSDKPDVRFGLEIQDITARLPHAVQNELQQRGEILEALIVPDESPFKSAAVGIQQAVLEAGVEQVELSKDGLLSWVEHSNALRHLSSFDGPDVATSLKSSFTDNGRMWVFKRLRRPEGGSTPLGRLRLHLSTRAQRIGDLVLPSMPHFLWVTEFPLFTRADTDKDFLAHGRWSSSHHPFTAPMWEDIGKLYDGRIHEVRGQHYDLVLNGVEIGGGSVRVHDAAMQEYIFSKVLQLTDNEKACFDHLLHALRCGAPPHGGIALGFDRLMAILCKAESIRDVIAFPKTSVGTDLLFNSPAPAAPDVLQQYNIRPTNQS